MDIDIKKEFLDKINNINKDIEIFEKFALNIDNKTILEEINKYKVTLKNLENFIKQYKTIKELEDLQEMVEIRMRSVNVLLIPDVKKMILFDKILDAEEDYQNNGDLNKYISRNQDIVNTVKQEKIYSSLWRGPRKVLEDNKDFLPETRFNKKINLLDNETIHVATTMQNEELYFKVIEEYDEIFGKLDDYCSRNDIRHLLKEAIQEFEKIGRKDYDSKKLENLSKQIELSKDPMIEKNKSLNLIKEINDSLSVTDKLYCQFAESEAKEIIKMLREKLKRLKKLSHNDNIEMMEGCSLCIDEIISYYEIESLHDEFNKITVANKEFREDLSIKKQESSI